MLGSTVTDIFSENLEFKIVATVYQSKEIELLKKKLPNVVWQTYDAESTDTKSITELLTGIDWVINCIGIIKPYIHDDNAKETLRAIRVNSIFPHQLAFSAEKSGTKVIQIATDCVYSGDKGKYIESDKHDALDVYGKTKSLGEAYSSNMFHLRDSIIGPELKSHLSLLDWFLTQPKNAAVYGYTNHLWNGVTSLHFAKLCQGIIVNDISIDHLQHIIPTGMLSKGEMLKCFAKEFKREDVNITLTDAPQLIDRTLLTENDDKNREIWAAAGYNIPPTVPEMIKELAEYYFDNLEMELE